MNFLIVNADDFGYCPKRDKAIVDLFKQRSISSTSLLVNGDNASQACLYAQQYQIPMGIHLNLTEGRPITKDLTKIKSLVDDNGLMHGKFGLQEKLDQGDIEQEHVEYEVRNQLNKYKELTNGKIPTHIDGHQHIHVHPTIVETIAKLTKEFGINYIRTPYDRMVDKLNIENLFYKNIVNQTRHAMKVFDKYSLRYSDYFFGMTTMGKEFTIKNLEHCFLILENNEEKGVIIELMCHPGFPSDRFIGGCGTERPDEFSQSIERQYEYNMLSSKIFKNILEKYNMNLSNYDEIIFKNKIDISTGKLNDDEANVDANHNE